jgi:hypothetical protein
VALDMSGSGFLWFRMTVRRLSGIFEWHIAKVESSMAGYDAQCSGVALSSQAFRWNAVVQNIKTDSSYCSALSAMSWPQKLNLGVLDAYSCIFGMNIVNTPALSATSPAKAPRSAGPINESPPDVPM